VFGANAGEVDSVSCAKAGPCAVGGYYVDGSAQAQAYLADETGGVWGAPAEVPGSGALNVTGAQVRSLSCVGTGSCAAAGDFRDNTGLQAFVTSP